MSEEFDTRGRNPQWTSEKKCTDGIRGDDDRNQREERIVDECPAVDGNLVEAKNKGNQSCQNCMESKERGEGDKNTK